MWRYRFLCMATSLTQHKEYNHGCKEKKEGCKEGCEESCKEGRTEEEGRKEKDCKEKEVSFQ